MKAKIISYNIAKQSIPVKNSLRKKLIGHNAVSHGGRYKYRIDGLLDQISHIKPSKNIIIAPTKEANEIINILKKHNAQIKVYDIQIDESEFKK